MSENDYAFPLECRTIIETNDGEGGRSHRCIDWMRHDGMSVLDVAAIAWLSGRATLRNPGTDAQVVAQALSVAREYVSQRG